MKTKLILLFAFLLASSLVYSQTSSKVQDSFYGCKFGTSIDAMTKAIRENGFRTQQQGKESLKAYDLLFAGYEFYSSTFSFVTNKLFCVEFSQHFGSINSAFSRYSEIKDDLVKKYGKLKDSSDNDLHYFYWSDGDNTVSISMSKKAEPSKAGASFYYVNLIYINKELSKKESEKNIGAL